MNCQIPRNFYIYEGMSCIYEEMFCIYEGMSCIFLQIILRLHRNIIFYSPHLDKLLLSAINVFSHG